MAIIDWLIVALYAASTLALGWYFGRGQTDTKEYFVGSGRMNPILIGVSLFATLLSSITYLAIPEEVVGKGPAYLSSYIAYPFVFLVVGFLILPVYMRQRVSSAYELLEERLGLSVRLLGGVMFLVLRLVWMSLLVLKTAEALAGMIGASESKVPVIVVITVAFAITYTSLGGLRAVVITDLMQTVLLYGGSLLVIGTITVKMGGFEWFPTEWQSDTWDSQPFFSFDPATRVTVVGSILSVFLWTACTSAGDQVSVQRFMATEDADSARRAIAIQLIVAIIVGATLGLVGLALVGYFQANPELLPNGWTLRGQAKDILPHFIREHLPPVVTGLVVSGLFAAAMSSIDSGVNSITAVVTNDFRGRFGSKPDTDAQRLRFARLLAVGIGFLVVSMSMIIQFIPGNIMTVTNKTVNLLTVPIALLFFFALYVPFAHARGVWVGAICSVIVAALIAFSGFFSWLFFGADPEIDPVSFQWISPAALVTGVVVGMLACKMIPAPMESTPRDAAE